MNKQCVFLFVSVLFLLRIHSFGQQANLIGLSYAQGFYSERNPYGISKYYDLKKAYPFYNLNYYHITKKQLVAFDISAGYLPFSYDYTEVRDSRYATGNWTSPEWWHSISYIKGNHLLIAQYLQFQDRDSRIKPFLSIGFEEEFRLNEKYDSYSTYIWQHADSTGFYPIRDSITTSFSGSYKEGFQVNAFFVGLKAGFLAELYNNFYCSFSLQIRGFFAYKEINLMSSGYVYGFRFGVFYRIPSRKSENINSD